MIFHLTSQSFLIRLEPFLPYPLCSSYLQMDTPDSHSVKSLSHVQLFATPWTVARQASLSITNSQSLLKHISIQLVMPSNNLILCRPLLLLPSVFPINHSLIWPNSPYSNFPNYPPKIFLLLSCSKITLLVTVLPLKSPLSKSSSSSFSMPLTCWRNSHPKLPLEFF